MQPHRSKMGSTLSFFSEYAHKTTNREKGIHYPVRSNNPDEKVDYFKTNPANTENMYGVSDLSEMPIFKNTSGLINFGFWNNSIDISTLDEIEYRQCRGDASKALYAKVLSLIEINHHSIVIDLGCGTGAGSSYINTTFSPKQVIGIDCKSQIQRSKKRHSNEKGLSFLVGNAKKIPLKDNSVTHIVSIEAAQHFPSLEKFLREAKRVLKPSGVLVFSSFFPTNQSSLSQIKQDITDYQVHGSQYTINDIKKLLHLLRNGEIISIGQYVFPKLEEWLYRHYPTQWTMLWPKYFKKGYIDYVICKAQNLPCKILDNNQIDFKNIEEKGEPNNGAVCITSKL
jgi:ubiquinone/menaquinone biosynthesis C-methylase UbiE